jgi:hypothetical protein
MSCKDSDLTIHPLLAKLDPQPDDQRRFITIYGYIGPSPREGVITLYTELDLSSYLEICKDDILSAEPAVPGQCSSPTKLLVTASAQVTRVRNTRTEVALDYLSGPISGALLPKASPGPAGDLRFKFEVASPGFLCGGTGSPNGPHPSSNCVRSGACLSDPIHLVDLP